MVTWENYEEYMMMHADGELRRTESGELMVFIHQHPELGKEMKAYELTRLTPYKSQIYKDKKSLLKPEPQKRTIVFPQWIKYGIAAGLAAIIAISVFKILSTNINKIEVAMKDKPQTPKVAFPKVVDSIGNSSKGATEIAGKNEAGSPNNFVKGSDFRSKNNNASAVAKSVAKISKRNSPRVLAKNNAGYSDLNRTHTVLSEPVEMVSMPVTTSAHMPFKTDSLPVPVLIDIPAYAIEPNHPTGIKKFWDKLPLDRRNKKQIENIAGFVASAYDGINTVKENIEDKSLNFKIENNQLVISVN